MNSALPPSSTKKMLPFPATVIVCFALKQADWPFATIWLITEIRDGMAGLTVMVNAGEAMPEPQIFVPVTVISPEDADEEKSTVMLFVFSPDPMTAPGGRVQLYPVAPVIGDTL